MAEGACVAGGHAWWGHACMAGGIHGRVACVARGMCMVEEACMAGGGHVSIPQNERRKLKRKKKRTPRLLPFPHHFSPV